MLKISKETISAVHLVSSLSKKAGGVQTALMGLLNHLSQKGVKIEIFSFVEKGEDPAKDGFRSKFKLFKRNFFPFFPFSFELLKAVEKAPASILHTHGLWQQPSIATKYWPEPKPLIITPHGMVDPWAMRNSAWKKKIALLVYERRNLDRCSCFHALNVSEYQAIRALGIKQPVAIIPNGVEMPQIFPIRQEKKIGKKTIFYLGRIHKKKNLIPLLRAWRSLPVSLKADWQLRLAGWGDEAYRRELSSLAGPGISLEGSMFGKEKEASFRMASAFVLPSLSEGLPMAILEAWSYGLPVLMSRECNLPDGFAANAAIETGTNERSMAEALEYILGMSERKQREMGLRGRKLVEENYDWVVSAQKMKSLYEWVLGGGTPPSFLRFN